MENLTCEFNYLDKAHAMVHDLDHSISNGNLINAKQKLSDLDILLHNTICAEQKANRLENALRKIIDCTGTSTLQNKIANEALYGII